MRHCGSTKYTESPNVQYILANNKQYKHFDVRKPVDWSVSTTEQSQNLQFVLLKFFLTIAFLKLIIYHNRLNDKMFSDVSPKRMNASTYSMTFEDQCRTITANSENKKYSVIEGENTVRG